MKKVLSIALFAVSSAYPWSVTPKAHNVTVYQPQAFFTVVGDERESLLPIEIFAANRLMDKDGNDTWEKNDEEFIIYPKQLVLKKGQQQLVRVIWKGKDKIASEKAYRIIFEEKPTPVAGVEGSKFAIGINTQNVCSFYVAKNSRGKPHIAVSDYKIDRSLLTCELSNMGDKHEVLKTQNMELVVKYKDPLGKLQNMIISGEKLGAQVHSAINVLAGHSRILYVPWEETYPTNIVSLEIGY